MKIFVILIFLSLGSIAFFLIDDEAIEKETFQVHTGVVELLDKLLTRWKQGDIEGNYAKDLFNCPQIPNKLSLDSKYFECNSLYYECYLKKKIKNSKPFLVKLENKEVPVEFLPLFTDEQLGRDYLKPVPEGYELKFKIKKNVYTIQLKNTCHDTYLPQRKYSSGPIIYSDKNKFYWDNFYRNFYLDKYIVPHYKVLEWAKLEKKEIPTVDKSKWHLPSTVLTMNQIDQFCNFHRSRPMLAKLLDAGSFLPVNEKITNPSIINKAPYPWSRKRSFFQEEEGLYDETKDNKKHCLYLYDKKCRDSGVSYNPYEDSTVTWIGLFNPLGGPMEFVRNDFEPSKNLVLSSYYFDVNDKNNQIGYRGIWTGAKQDIMSIEFANSLIPNMDIFSDVKIGFRCYKQRP